MLLRLLSTLFPMLLLLLLESLGLLGQFLVLIGLRMLESGVSSSAADLEASEYTYS